MPKRPPKKNDANCHRCHGDGIVKKENPTPVDGEMIAILRQTTHNLDERVIGLLTNYDACDCESPEYKEYEHHRRIVQGIRNKIDKFGAPEVMWDYTINDIKKKNSLILQMVSTQTLDRGQRFYVITGGTPGERTSYAIGVPTYRMFCFGEQWKFIDAHEYLDILRESYGPNRDGVSENLSDLYMECDGTVIHDLWFDKLTDWGREALTSFVKAMYHRGHPLIVTSSHNLFKHAGDMSQELIHQILTRGMHISLDEAFGDDATK